MRSGASGYDAVKFPLVSKVGTVEVEDAGTFHILMIRDGWRVVVVEKADPPEHDRPICGAILRLIGEPCARRPGHRSGKGGGHRSVESLRSDAQRRRKWSA